MLTKTSLLNTLKSKKSKLDHFGVSRIGLFGSFVRNQQTQDSDIDFLVEFQQGKKTYDNFIHLSFFLEELFHKKVGLITPKSISPYFKPYIESEVEFVDFG